MKFLQCLFYNFMVGSYSRHCASVDVSRWKVTLFQRVWCRPVPNDASMNTHLVDTNVCQSYLKCLVVPLKEKTCRNNANINCGFVAQYINEVRYWCHSGHCIRVIRKGRLFHRFLLTQNNEFCPTFENKIHTSCSSG